jgi:hypothetical protein
MGSSYLLATQASIKAHGSDSSRSGDLGNRGGARDVVLEGYFRAVELGREPTDSKNSPRSLPKFIIDRGLARGYTRRDLWIAMRLLMLEGVLKRCDTGRYPNRTRKYVLALDTHRVVELHGLTDSRASV